MMIYVWCPFCRRVEECYYDGYEAECPTTGNSFIPKKF